MGPISRTAKPALFSLTLSALGLIAAPAFANDIAMPLGLPASIPAGFLDLCARAPEDCAEPGVEVADIHDQARRMFWAGVFERQSGPRAAADAPAAARPYPRPSRLGFGRNAARPRRDLQGSDRPRYFAPALEPNGLEPKGGERAERERPQPALSLTTKDWERIDRVNRDLNRQIRQVSDQRQFGVADYWAAPTGRSPRGDCEDYVLAKRRALIDLGYARSAFSIALVVTTWGEEHAVLLMATSEGEVVLDNLSQRIVRWNEADYTWVKRQAPGRALTWASIG